MKRISLYARSISIHRIINVGPRYWYWQGFKLLKHRLSVYAVCAGFLPVAIIATAFMALDLQAQLLAITDFMGIIVIPKSSPNIPGSTYLLFGGVIYGSFCIKA